MKSKILRICFLGIATLLNCNQSLEYAEDHFIFDDIFDFYTRQSEITSPGKYEFLYEGLPADPVKLVDVIQGLMISEGLSYAAGISEKEIAHKAYDLVKIEDILQRVHKSDERSLTVPREPQDRLYGICSNFATLYCSMLRYKDIPSRVRSGYQAYSSNRRFVNHYVCEYWDKSNQVWIPVDPEIPRHLNISFDNFTSQEKIPEYTFITAGYAWLLVREGILDPSGFGLGSGGEWESFGWDMLRPGVYSDFMALNKFEMHPWDVPKVWDNERLDVNFVDSIARLTQNDDFFERRIQLYKSDDRMVLPKKLR